MSTASKVIARTDRQTDRHDENIISTTYAGDKKTLIKRHIPRQKIKVQPPVYFKLSYL